MNPRRWTLGLVLAAIALALVGCSDTPANDIEVGECTNDSLVGSVGELDTVDCDEEHTGEVFAKFDVEGDDYDAEQIASESEECIGERFEDYVGIPYAESVFTAAPLTPSADSWDGGDRTIICFIDGRADGEPLEGSAEGDDTPLAG
jgi:hypothetical protein